MRIFILSLLMLSGAVLAEEQDPLQQLTSYFFAAARTGDLVVLNEFLQQGFPVDQRNSHSYTALMGAIVKAEWTIGSILYPIDCNEDGSIDAKAPVTDKDKMTVAQFAEVFGQSEKLQQLANYVAAKQSASKN